MLLHGTWCYQPLLEVGLSINVGSLNVAYVIRVTRMEQQNVCRYDLIARKTDKVPNTKMGPPFLNKATTFPVM